MKTINVKSNTIDYLKKYEGKRCLFSIHSLSDPNMVFRFSGVLTISGNLERRNLMVHIDNNQSIFPLSCVTRYEYVRITNTLFLELVTGGTCLYLEICRS